jgi:beta-glucosidase
MQRIAIEESRLHIPLLFALDVIHGFRTIFPVPLAEAASVDPATAEQAARAAAVEASAHGLHWTFALMVDIARDPRWGRIVEGAGEAPWLGSQFAAARTRGFQGGDLRRRDALLATAKHFAAYGAPEGGRDYAPAELSERTMWEVYLPPFEAAVRAGAGSIMPSFNEVGGTPAHASDWLLRDVLRDRWGFCGVVVSDWAGVSELQQHGVAATAREAAIRGMRAGVDVDMVSGVYGDSLRSAVRAGQLPVAVIDDAVRRVLRVKVPMGLFDDPYARHDAARERAAQERGRDAPALDRPPLHRRRRPARRRLGLGARAVGGARAAGRGVDGARRDPRGGGAGWRARWAGGSRSSPC